MFVVVDHDNPRDVYGPFDSEEEAKAYMNALGAKQGWGPTKDELKAEPRLLDDIFNFGLECVELNKPEVD